MRKKLVRLGLVIACIASGAAAENYLVEAESLPEHGGWVLDQQFMDQMGSPYLLAHGLGVPVADATGMVRVAAGGTYHLWVRTKDWVAPWKAPGAPGRFQVLINGKPVPVTFGTEGAEWHWQDGGKVEIPGTGAAVALHDLTGFEGRCDALLFSSDPAYVPPADRSSLSPPQDPLDGGSYDLVVVGGGIAGTCAAVKASRLGLHVALVQDRPVLGGNGSSEVRVWPEGGIRLQPYPNVGSLVAELVPEKKSGHGNAGAAAIFADDRKLAVVSAERNLRLFLDTRVNGVETADGAVSAVIGQNTRTGARMRLAARWFADCTGDGTVGFLAGADNEMTHDGHMGASNLWNLKDTGASEAFPPCECTDTNALALAAVQTATAAPFPRCPWALDLSGAAFPGRPAKGKETPAADIVKRLGGWFWESGFDRDPIADVELMRDLNFRAMYGAWDTLKNVDKALPNYRLNWAAYIAGKRESRRLLGDVILNGEDFRLKRQFPDACFPCTWSIDLHLPDPAYDKSFKGNEFISRANFNKYAGPYWAPYRCLYSRNVKNLFMAGRNISVTHEALGAVRVMRTCGMMGEVVGMAASLCKKYETTPRGVYEKHLEELKDLLEGAR